MPSTLAHKKRMLEHLEKQEIASNNERDSKPSKPMGHCWRCHQWSRVSVFDPIGWLCEACEQHEIERRKVYLPLKLIAGNEQLKDEAP